MESPIVPFTWSFQRRIKPLGERSVDFSQRPCTGRKTPVRVVVHGDDFLAVGDRSGLDDLDALLRKSYELKRLGTLGDEEADDKEVHFRNRLIRVGTYHNHPAVFLEPDRRHVDLLIRNLGLEQAKGVDTPDVKKSVDQQMLESRSPILGFSEISVECDEGSIPITRPA